MTERHHGQMALRTARTTTGQPALTRSGGRADGTKWREAGNGKPAFVPYARGPGDAEREAEVAALVAAARAEALRRAREALGPGPLQRRAAGGFWEPVDEEGSACVSTDASNPAAVHLEHLNQSGTKPPAAAEPRSWVIAMPAGMELLNANDRVHWRRRQRLTMVLRQAAGWAARAAKVPRLERAHILAEYQPPDRRRRDPANLYPSVKACVDGICTDAGVLADDDAAHLEGPDMRLGELFPPYGRLVLIVTELPAGESR